MKQIQAEVKEMTRCEWDQLSPHERLDAKLRYEGIIGFTTAILEWARLCGYKVEVKDGK